MKVPLAGILTEHGITDEADVAFVQVAGDAAAAAMTPPSVIVSRQKFEHPDDKKLATAIAEVVQSAQRKGRLILITFLATAVPLAAIIAIVALTGASRERALSQDVKRLQDQYAAEQNDARKVAQDSRDAAGRVMEEALASQQSASQNTKSLALEFAATIKTQSDEIASLKAVNEQLKGELVKAQQGRQP